MSAKGTPTQMKKYKNVILNRPAFSFEYVGEDYASKPHKTIILDDGDFISEEELIVLREKYYLVVATGKPKEQNQVEEMCKQLGIRTEQLYYTSGGQLVRNGKFKKV